MLDGRVHAARRSSISPLRALPRETDELNVQRMLGYTRAGVLALPAGCRARRASRRALETCPATRAGRAPTSSLKSAWFTALRDIARHAADARVARAGLAEDEDVPGLTLAEPDYITLALELAVREVPAWNEILEQQLARIENPDRKARFAFVQAGAVAGSGDRDAFFERLKDVANRRREPWVLEGLCYLHHPLRAAASEKYIPPSLDLLREIQRTGDIFFPKRWMDATLGGHSSPAALEW